MGCGERKDEDKIVMFAATQRELFVILYLSLRDLRRLFFVRFKSKGSSCHDVMPDFALKFENLT